MSRMAFATLFGLAFLATAAAETLKETTPHISVIGEAFEEAVPDQATLVIGVVTEKPTALEAGGENSRKTQAIVEELASEGIDAKDIRTESFTLAPFVSSEPQPLRGPQPGAGKKPVRGFRARSELFVTVKPAEKVGALVERSIDTGANEIRDVTFTVSDEAARLERLRGLAMNDAVQRVKSYTEAIGVKLGRVIEITPMDELAARPKLLAAPAAASGEAPAETLVLQPGLRKLGSRVMVTWSLLR
jgi:uncharacterized protein